MSVTQTDRHSLWVSVTHTDRHSQWMCVSVSDRHSLWVSVTHTDSHSLGHLSDIKLTNWQLMTSCLCRSCHWDSVFPCLESVPSQLSELVHSPTINKQTHAVIVTLQKSIIYRTCTTLHVQLTENNTAAIPWRPCSCPLRHRWKTWTSGAVNVQPASPADSTLGQTYNSISNSSLTPVCNR